MRTFICQACGTGFTRDVSRTVERKYCSRECSWAGRKKYDGSETELDCRKCGEVKPVTEFYPHATLVRGYQYWCIGCSLVHRAARQKIQSTQEMNRRWRLWALYRIREEDYDRMYRDQVGCCAICKIPQEPWSAGLGKKRSGFLLVDHDHETGKVRQLLCSRCNQGLGLFREDRESLLAAAEYLHRHRTEEAA